MTPLDQSLLQLHKHATLLDKSDIPVREDKACATDRPNYREGRRKFAPVPTSQTLFQKIGTVVYKWTILRVSDMYLICIDRYLYIEANL